MIAGLDWTILALLASFFWGLVNFLDKSILSRYLLNPFDYLALDGFVAVIPLALILILQDNTLSTAKDTVILAMLSGVALAVFSILYFAALQRSDVTVVVTLIQTVPVFSLLWGLVLLNEHYVFPNYVGMLLILVGAGIASISEKKTLSKSIKRKKSTSTLTAAALTLTASFVMSIGFLIQKVALEKSTILSFFFWQRFSVVLISILILVVRNVTIRRLPLSPIALTSAVEVINLLGVVTIIAAYSIGPLVGVSFLSSLQPVWVLILVWILSSLWPDAFPQNKRISRAMIVFACIFVVAGLYFIQS